jgi:hypothetical protein
LLMTRRAVPETNTSSLQHSLKNTSLTGTSLMISEPLLLPVILALVLISSTGVAGVTSLFRQEVIKRTENRMNGVIFFIIIFLVFKIDCNEFY